MFPYRLRALGGGLAEGVREVGGRGHGRGGAVREVGLQQHRHPAQPGQRVLRVVRRDPGQAAVAYGFVLRAGDRRVPGGAGGEQGVPDVVGGGGRGVRVVAQYGAPTGSPLS